MLIRSVSLNIYVSPFFVIPFNNNTLSLLALAGRPSSTVDKARVYKNSTLVALVLRQKLDLIDAVTSQTINFITFSTQIVDIAFTNRTFDHFFLNNQLFSQFSSVTRKLYLCI